MHACTQSNKSKHKYMQRFIQELNEGRRTIQVHFINFGYT